jgi:hypothetical protein
LVNEIDQYWPLIYSFIFFGAGDLTQGLVHTR